jgi:hypothetical protein
MPYLTLAEAAIKIAYSVELILQLTKTCPKSGETRVLPASETPSGLLIDERELIEYQHYLNQPWPLPPKGQRPRIPKAIADDVRSESHFACAICGHMDNGELAHIEPCATSLNNSPDNLIYLCPNHHSKYDLGFVPATNITQVDIEAAKQLKRLSRVRMLRHEANATKTLRALLEFCAKLDFDSRTAPSADLRTISVTELKNLIAAIPELSRKACEQAKRDSPVDSIDAELVRIAPSIAVCAQRTMDSSSEVDVRRNARSTIATAKSVIIDIDEVLCPHCGGRGQTGLGGRFCAFCKGSCFVSRAKHSAYDRSCIDEVDCPRCGGTGQTGFAGDLCSYCKGDGFVTHEEFDSYDEKDMDEVDCPHCEGDGRYGYDAICAYCRGSCYVSREKAAAYNRAAIDEVECPRCSGTGQTGLAGDLCCYCKGNAFVTQQKCDSYDEKDMDEVDCPHCGGAGRYGYDTVCVYCRGSCYVSREKAAAYNRAAIDEVECPRCSGTGQTGLAGDLCALCRGATIVPRDTRRAYVEKYE